MTLFMKYPSLTNHYAISAGTRGIYAHLNSQWYATEKIDGANVSVNIDLQMTRTVVIVTPPLLTKGSRCLLLETA